jgi:hypothetical protein
VGTVLGGGDHASQLVDTATRRQRLAPYYGLIGQIIIVTDLLLQLRDETVLILQLLIVDQLQLLLKAHAFLIALPLDCLDLAQEIFFLIIRLIHGTMFCFSSS